MLEPPGTGLSVNTQEAVQSEFTLQVVPGAHSIIAQGFASHSAGPFGCDGRIAFLGAALLSATHLPLQSLFALQVVPAMQRMTAHGFTLHLLSCTAGFGGTGLTGFAIQLAVQSLLLTLHKLPSAQVVKAHGLFSHRVLGCVEGFLGSGLTGFGAQPAVQSALTLQYVVALHLTVMQGSGLQVRFPSGFFTTTHKKPRAY